MKIDKRIFGDLVVYDSIELIKLKEAIEEQLSHRSIDLKNAQKGKELK